MNLIIKTFKIILNFIYFFMKLFKTKNNRVIFISRQSNKITLDFKMIIDELNKNNNYDIIVFCKRFDNIKKHIFSYSTYTLKTMFYLATSKVCVIDSYCLPVSILKHKKNLKVMQIWHSLGAIKKFGYQTVDTPYGRSKTIAEGLNMHKNYDEIISGSKNMSKYFALAFNYDIESFKNYGLPRIDYLINNKNDIKKNIYKKYSGLKKKKTILYAPTFRPDSTNSINQVIETIDYRKYNLIVKAHPNQIINIQKKQVYTCPDVSSLDLLTITDYLITDYSAIAIEGASIDVKTYYFVFDYDSYKEKNGLNIDLYKEMPGYVFNDFKKLYKKLDEEVYDTKVLKKYKDKYLDNTKGNSTKLIVKQIKDWCHTRWYNEKNKSTNNKFLQKTCFF